MRVQGLGSRRRSPCPLCHDSGFSVQEIHPPTLKAHTLIEKEKKGKEKEQKSRFKPQDCRSLLNLLLHDATGLPAAFSINPPRCASSRRTWDVDAASSELGSTLILLSGFTESIGIPGLLDAIGLDAAEELLNKIRRHIHHCWSRLGHNSFFFFFWSWILFAIVEQLIKLTFLVQEVELKWLISNNWRRLFHLSRVKFPFTQHVCELVLGVNVFDLDLGVQIDSIKQPIKSNSVGSGNMSHCGASSFVIILITASWSSNTYNKASWCENWTFEGTQSILFKTLIIPWDRLFGPWFLSQFTTGCSVLSWVWIVFPRTKTLRSHKSRAGIPSNLNPGSKEMISDFKDVQRSLLTRRIHIWGNKNNNVSIINHSMRLLSFMNCVRCCTNLHDMSLALQIARTRQCALSWSTVRLQLFSGILHQYKSLSIDLVVEAFPLVPCTSAIKFLVQESLSKV